MLGCMPCCAKLLCLHYCALQLLVLMIKFAVMMLAFKAATNIELKAAGDFVGAGLGRYVCQE